MKGLYLFLKKVDHVIESGSKWLLVASIFLMLVLTVTSIVMRWFSHTSLWIDPFVRHIVFLSAFLGGVMATGNKQHIGIDILARALEKKQKISFLLTIKRIIYLTAMVTLMWIIISSFSFVKDAFDYEGIVFMGIHRGFLVSIIPFGLSLIWLRFFYLLVETFFDHEKAIQVGEGA